MNWWRRHRERRKQQQADADREELLPLWISELEQDPVPYPSPMEQLEYHEAMVSHYRKLQSGQDSRTPIGPGLTGATVSGLGNTTPEDIGYGRSEDTWEYLESLIQQEMEVVADIKRSMGDTGNFQPDDED